METDVVVLVAVIDRSVATKWRSITVAVQLMSSILSMNITSLSQSGTFSLTSVSLTARKSFHRPPKAYL